MTPLLLSCAWITDTELTARKDYDADGEIASQFGGNDCVDNDPTIAPTIEETCNGIDDNCDGTIDEDSAVDAPTWYADPDGDGYGSTETRACTQPDGYAALGGDCADGDAGMHPGAVETWYDGLDQDCDGASDYDQDGDSYDIGAECDDTDASISPAATEVYYDGVDQNCDRRSDDDADQDGFDVGLDCDDANAAIYPGAPDDWYDGVDANCDTLSDFDADLDTYDDPISGGPDCDDGDASIHPGAAEYCDGVDRDCDGSVYEDDSLDAPGWFLDLDSDGYGDASTEHPACSQPDGSVADATDCDDTDPAVAHRIWYADADADGFGADVSAESCEAPAGYVADGTDCNDSDATISPAATEVCDVPNVDEDCDGLADDNDTGASGVVTYYADVDGDRYGDATNTIALCDRIYGYVTNSSDCDDSDADVNPGEDEVCDALDTDDDCDGYPDETDDSVTNASDYYVDADGDGYGEGGSAAVPLCESKSGYVTNDADCDDADASVTPAEGDCSIDLGAADVILEGESKYDEAGSAVAAGDFDGDGHMDLLVGAQASSSSATEAGSAYVLTGIAAGSTALSSTVTYRGEASRDWLGHSVASGDVDGDGIDDVLIGAPYGYWDAGAIYVEFGAPSGGLASVDATLTGTVAGREMGWSLTTGNADGDGQADVLVGTYADVALAPNIPSGSSFFSSLAYYGYIIQGEGLADEFGRYAATLGDVDGNGLDDLFVGAPSEDTSGENAGVMYLFLNPDSSTTSAAAADAKLLGAERSDNLGRAGAMGDADGDGDDDLIAGAPFASDPDSNGGAVYVLTTLPSSSTAISSATARYTGGQVYACAGGIISHGDFDADGVADLAIGTTTNCSINQAWAVLGPHAGNITLSGADHTFVGEGSGDYAGTSVATGDIDADSYDDIIIGAPYNDNAGTDAGAAYIVYGSGL